MPLNTRFIDTCKEIIEDSERQYCEDCKHCRRDNFWRFSHLGYKFSKCAISHDGNFYAFPDSASIRDKHELAVYRKAFEIKKDEVLSSHSYCSTMRIGRETICPKFEPKSP